MKLHIFHTGKVKVDCAIPLRESNPLAKTGFLRAKDKKLLLPVSAYLIQHKNENILIDAGWDSKYAHQKPKELFGLVNRISGPVINENESVDAKLGAVGLKTSDISKVFISHMDFDHTSGLRLLQNAGEIFTSKEEWNAASRFSFRYVDTWSDYVDIKTFEYENTGIGPFKRSYDVTGDGKIQLIHTPGHSKGLFSVKITNGDEYVVLGNDAAYLQKSFDEKIIPGFTVDKNDALKSLNWLCECRKDKKCLGVFVNHDPSVFEQTMVL